MGTAIDIDGNIYDTVIIGHQEWFAQNLKVTQFNDGTAIQEITNSSDWLAMYTGDIRTPARCWYDNDDAYKEVYGSLYNWFTVSSGKLAPSGWRVATDTDWRVLTEYLDGSSVAGGNLKHVGTTYWQTPNAGATNVVGFSAMPAGFRTSTGTFAFMSQLGFWWSSNVYNTTNSLYHFVRYDNATITRSSLYYHYGLSIRCVRTISLFNESQFNWVPPSDYPFTPNNDLYDKDINYIRSHKSKLRPFSGITAPPNPGYNFSAYPGYETGLFGYPRLNYRVSGSGS